jgi:tripartite ATP-independent transporter DctM subunit
MDWYVVLLLIFGSLVVLMAIGVPVAFAFMAICIVGSVMFWGGQVGLEQVIRSFFSSVSTFTFLPVPLFVLMGNVIYDSGVGMLVVDAVDKLLGRLPGRLSLLAIAAGTLLGTMIGISGASIAILTKSLVPEMTRRGYKKEMSLGPIIASGMLAVMIPPSAAAIILGAIGRVSIGKLLIAIIMPGLLIAFLLAAYVIARCILQPSMAPSYVAVRVPLKDKLNSVVRHLLPLGVIIFAVIGTIYLGIASPSEAAALGAVACFLLAAFHRKLNWQTVKKSVASTIHITAMVLIIVAASVSFSKILATSGAITGLINLATSFSVAPIIIIIATQILVLILGCFMDPISILMITLPMFMPIVSALGFDTLWYAVILMINIQLALITPPFGMDCYTMKALAPPDVSIGDVFKSSTPLLMLGLGVMVLIMIFPQIATWLPSVAK